MFNLNRGVSAPSAIILIVILSLFLIGGILVYQKLLIPDQTTGEMVGIFNDEGAYKSADVFFSDEIQGTVYLKSSNIKTETIKNSWCGGNAGSKEQKGSFVLSFKGSKLDIGSLIFVEGTAHNGKLHLRKLSPDNSQDFIILLQFGSCNFEIARFYGYDFDKQRLIKYDFKTKEGGILNEVYVGSEIVEVLSSKDFTVSMYDNSLGKSRVTKWRFNSQENIFEEVNSWIE